MQWSLLGAQTMLNIRTVALNDDWTAFNNFRIQQETKRLYPYQNHLKSRQSPLLA
ncbi:MAG: hypothetical protein AAFY72_07565 [Cyanobacteria bacterium J06649_4]